MTYTYTWTDADQSSLRREDEAGNVAFVPVAPGNRDYAEFVASAAVATAYVEPPAPTPLTTEEKIISLGFEADELTEYLVNKIQLRLEA